MRPSHRNSGRLWAPGASSRLVAMLGPTNTGKTHHALERMQQFDSGMIGLPLRLLAREVYDKLSEALGERAVALITGEEKRIGARARYFVCTVEAMPTDREVDFVAIDEIQLAAHPQRGHIFTERLLNLRGRQETWFLGAETIAPLISQLVPTATIERRSRLSVLSGKGQQRFSALPKRSAVVAFSVTEVYRLAEQLKHRKGGAAVVFGGLSPRARNAQIALYESGEVNYVVATDAIGMGLNLNIRHVAFAGVEKFDGRSQRPLDCAELAQIAGRAGRHLKSGSFGTLAPQLALSAGLTRNIEEHRFPRLSRLVWRNNDLSFDSLESLRGSLSVQPPSPLMMASLPGSDALALGAVRQDPDVLKLAQGREAVELLWQICQIPDYGHGVSNLHSALVREVYGQVAGGAGHLDERWLEQNLSELDQPLGDVDTLTARVSQLRTWSYLCNQATWLRDPSRWRTRTEDIERRLSDALHERLVERFVHTPSRSASAGPWNSAPSLEHATSENHPMGALLDLQRKLRPQTPVTKTTEAWLEDLLAEGSSSLRCEASGSICEGEQQLARLRRGRTRTRPEVTLTAQGLTPGQHLRLTRKLQAWSKDLVQNLLEALLAPPRRPWSPAGRGLVYQLEQSLGTISTRAARDQVACLTRGDRLNLRSAQVHLGRQTVFAESATGESSLRQRFALSHAFDPIPRGALPPYPLPPVFPADARVREEWLWALGHCRVGSLAVCARRLEVLARELSQQEKQGPFPFPSELSMDLSINSNEEQILAKHLGYQRGTDQLYRSKKRKRRRARRSNPTAET